MVSLLVYICHVPLLFKINVLHMKRIGIAASNFPNVF